MSLESDVYTALNVAAVRALVSDRIRPEAAAQADATPYVVYVLVSTVPVADLAGTETLAQHRIQVDCIADSADEAAALNRAVIFAMRSAVATLKNRWVDTRSLPFDAGTRRFGVSSDFLVWNG